MSGQSSSHAEGSRRFVIVVTMTGLILMACLISGCIESPEPPVSEQYPFMPGNYVGTFECYSYTVCNKVEFVVTNPVEQVKELEMCFQFTPFLPTMKDDIIEVKNLLETIYVIYDHWDLETQIEDRYSLKVNVSMVSESSCRGKVFLFDSFSYSGATFSFTAHNIEGVLH